MIQIYMNANIMNMQIFHFIKSERSEKATYFYFNFNLRFYGQLYFLVLSFLYSSP